MANETEEIKQKLDLTEIIGEYVKVIPAGDNIKALCPFHNEKTPSFMASRSKQIWKCFGCGEGGDLFDFVMKIEGLEFSEALKLLAQKAGVKLAARANPALTNKKDRLFKLNDLTSRYWHKILMESNQAEAVRQYLSQREISEDAQEDFRLGHAPDSWDNLLNFLKSKGYSEEEIFLAGLSVKKDKGFGFYDRFRGRLMFPIIDHLGRVVGFGGRSLQTGDIAKYINTSQTMIYDKSQVLYGINRAKDEIRKNDLCILVEGYMDVIPLHQAGIKNVVSISGTALTSGQLSLIKRYSNNIVLALDMDSAGQQAALRSIDTALAFGINIKIANLPEGKDPGEYIKANPDQWPKIMAKAQPVMDYFFSRAQSQYDINDPNQKNKIVNFLLPKIIAISSKIEQDYWLKELAQLIGISESVIRETALALRPNNNSKPHRFNLSKDSSDKLADKESYLFSHILALVILETSLIDWLVQVLDFDYFQSDFLLGIYKRIIMFYNKSNDQNFFDGFKQYLKEQNFDSEVKFLDEVFLLAQKEYLAYSQIELKNDLEKFVKLFKNYYLDQQIKVYQIKLVQLEKAGEHKEVDEVYKKLNELIKNKSNNT